MRRLLGIIICCFVLATGYFAYVIAERQTTLRKFARYNDSWSVSQTVSEYMRLEHQLASYAIDMTEERRDEVRLRLDIMLSRLELLQQGTLQAFIDGGDGRRDLVNSLRASLESLDANLEKLNASEIRELLQTMAVLDGPLTAFASAAVAYDVSLIDKTQAELRELHFIYSGMAAGLILCGVMLVMMLLRHNNLLDKAHGRMKGLTDDLRRASGELQSQNYRLAHAAHHDALTGLPNRILFRQDLERRLKEATANGPSAVILLFDLDGFKDVNDTLGHDVGDALLRAVAERLTSLSFEGDLICRLGGDEFAIVTTGLYEQEAVAFAHILMNGIGQPYFVSGREIKIATCIGVAISESDSNSEDLFKHTDLALYEAKASGSGHICVFHEQMQIKLTERKSFETDLHEALQNGELRVYYQPQADTYTREICGYEALLRWFHPIRGEVPPSEFIPVAEKTGLIHALGDWILNVACKEATRWNKPLRVAVNLSPVQFHNRNLIETVISALEKSGLPADRLELEITESVLLDKNEQTLEALRTFKALGIMIAMDDFGTGYSSLGSLSGFPFDKIKIDRSFVRDVTTRPDSLAIVELVTGVGKSLHMTTIAEGIETEEQLDCMKRLGCNQIQGYLIGRPVPVTEISHLYQ